MSKITKETAKNTLLDALHFVGLVLSTSVVVLLVMGIVSWAIGWHTLPQYADMLMYAGIVIALFGFFMSKGDPSQTNNFQSGQNIRQKFAVSDQPHKYETVNKMMIYRLEGQVLVAFFAVIGGLMIACSALIYTYLVN